MSMIGPLLAEGGTLRYSGGSIWDHVDDVEAVAPPSFRDSVKAFASDDGVRCLELTRLFHSITKATAELLSNEGAIRIDLPIITRMISSPGAVSGTIPTDVDPFCVDFFGTSKYLTQSSQLYLELALLISGIDSVFCIEKSFRREPANFRHLPEFNHIEYEGRGQLPDAIEHQARFLYQLVEHILSNCVAQLEFFGSKRRIERLWSVLEPGRYEVIDFQSALKLLYDATGDDRYQRSDNRVQAFDAYAEIKLTHLMGDRPVFVTAYPADEVAFYHAETGQPRVALNADLLLPGLGEVIGSGERLRTAEQIREKVLRHRIPMEDYLPYIESRSLDSGEPHFGWGLGVERFLQVITNQPFIWHCRLFPRIDGRLEI